MSNDNINDEFKKEFFREYDEQEAKLKRPHIVLCGYTGTGKSSLAKAILGDIVPKDAIGTGEPQTRGFNRYENDEVVLFDSQGFEAGQTEGEFLGIVKKFIREQQKDLNNVDEHLHIVWYTISLPGARVTPCDLELIKKIFNPKDTIVVLTKKDSARASQIDAMRKTLTDNGINPEKIVETTDEEGGSVGCDELMKLTAKMLPDAYRDAFVLAQKINVEMKIDVIKGKVGNAKRIVTGAVTATAAAGAIPIPGSDAPIIMGVQAAMIAGLCSLYGFRKDQVKTSVFPFLAKVVGMSAASQLTKIIPGLGSAINAAVAGSITGAIGWYCINVFESMAICKVKGEKVEFPDFSLNEFKRFYESYRSRKDGVA